MNKIRISETVLALVGAVVAGLLSIGTVSSANSTVAEEASASDGNSTRVLSGLPAVQTLSASETNAVASVLQGRIVEMGAAGNVEVFFRWHRDPEIAIRSPYEDLDWDTVNQYKSAFHVHRRGYSVQDVVEMHENYGYDVFALTGNWEHFPTSSDTMLTIDGVEHNHGFQHLVYLFGTYSSEPGKDFDRSIEDAKADGGLLLMAHLNDPGRHDLSVDQFYDYLTRHEHMVGIEIISRNYMPQPNSGDNIHPHRRGKGNYVRVGRIWDAMLKNYGVKTWGSAWAFGVTDGYPDHIDRVEFTEGQTIFNSSWQRVLAPERTEAAIRKGVESGTSFFVSNMGDQEMEPPMVRRIDVNGDTIELTIDGEYEKVKWIFDQETVQTGETFRISERRSGQNYVRFEIWTHTGYYEADIVGSQPIFLTGGPEWIETETITSGEEGAFSARITGLESGSTYFFQAVVRDETGAEMTGETQTFTTAAALSPSSD